MRYLASLSFLAASLAAAPQAPEPPKFEVIFSGTLDMGPVDTIEGPFGTRLHATVNGANFTDPSGRPVATLLPTADTGLFDQSGVFFPEAVFAIRWDVDGKLAHMRAKGVGLFGNDLVYIHAETDSKIWSGLNRRFLIGGVKSPHDSDAFIFTLFGVV